MWCSGPHFCSKFVQVQMHTWPKSSSSTPSYLKEWRQHWSWGILEWIEAMSTPQSHPNKEHSSSQQRCICHVSSKNRWKESLRPCYNYFSMEEWIGIYTVTTAIPSCYTTEPCTAIYKQKTRKTYSTTLKKGKWIQKRKKKKSTSAA